ncbi:MAG: hypothetical protein ACR2FN_08695 [Chitinophagaceae bacterium]
MVHRHLQNADDKITDDDLRNITVGVSETTGSSALEDGKEIESQGCK